MTADQLSGPQFGGEIDPMANPDLANAIGRIVMGEDPVSKPILIQNPPDGSVTLAGGYLDDGELVRNAQVRELCGADEEELSKPAYAKDFIKLMDALLARCVVSLGDKPAKKRVLDKLLIGDRDLLLQAIRVVTYGDTMKLGITCPMTGCGNEFKVAYQFSEDVKIRPLDGIEVELNDGVNTVKLVDGHFVYSIPLRKGGTADVALVDGAAQRAVYTHENSKLTTPERNTLLLQQCIQLIRGEPPFPDDIRRMGSGDRMQILAFLAESQPGPQWSEVKATCPSCDREFPLVIDVPTMFRGF